MSERLAESAGLDDDDLDALAAWVEERRKSKTERQARASLEAKIDALSDRSLSDDEVDRIAAAVLARSQAAPSGGDGAGADGQGAGDDGGSGSGDAGAGSDDPDPKSQRKRYRPGRRSGNVYDFDVDDDGNVTKLDVARVYTGEDEPDRVELPAAKDDGGDD